MCIFFFDGMSCAFDLKGQVKIFIASNGKRPTCIYNSITLYNYRTFFKYIELNDCLTFKIGHVKKLCTTLPVIYVLFNVHN